MKLILSLTLFVYTIACVCSVEIQDDFKLKKTINRRKNLKMPSLVMDESIKPTHHIVSGRIIRGKHAKSIAQFPYQANLLLKSNLQTSDEYDEYNRCSGSIISPDWVVTAAHCLDDSSDGYVFVGCLNITQLTNGCQKIKVTPKNYIMHPNYTCTSDNSQNDIGLVKLPFSLKFSDTIKNIQLNTNHHVKHGKKAILSGYGETENGGVSDVLKYTSVKVISNKICRKSYPFIRSTVICYGATGTNSACQGDSGGPMTIHADGQPLLVGVTSFSGEICEKTPGVYTRIRSYLKWICEKTNIC